MPAAVRLGAHLLAWVLVAASMTRETRYTRLERACPRRRMGLQWLGADALINNRREIPSGTVVGLQRCWLCTLCSGSLAVADSDPHAEERAVATTVWRRLPLAREGVLDLANIAGHCRIRPQPHQRAVPRL